MFASFKRAQISALIATAVDFGTLVFSVEILHIYYVIATALGAFCGAVANFVLNRYWSFEATHSPAPGQALKYALVSAGSLGLNSLGVWLFTEYAGFKYTLSKVCTAVLVGIVYNFPLHRGFVFGRKGQHAENADSPA